MKERPILFSGPMVRAILAGTKTQTRRVCKARDVSGQPLSEYSGDALDALVRSLSPYGKPGDRLWVRENGWQRPERTQRMMRDGADTWEPYYYDADGYTDLEREQFKEWGFKRRPSIHMPRWASRILLEVTDVRVERLQDISEDDAMAEGIDPLQNHPGRFVSEHSPGLNFPSAKAAYRDLWEHINGPGSWDANPWVWAVIFRRIQP